MQSEDACCQMKPVFSKNGFNRFIVKVMSKKNLLNKNIIFLYETSKFVLLYLLKWFNVGGRKLVQNKVTFINLRYF